jgi:hypothetical protein
MHHQPPISDLPATRCRSVTTHLRFKLSRQVSRLKTLEDMEIIVGRVSTTMTLSPDSGTEDDQVPYNPFKSTSGCQLNRTVETDSRLTR